MTSALPVLHSAAVAEHYDQLNQFYREIWGDHVHHGLWLSGRESHHEATLQLVRHIAGLGKITPGASVCDIGCGYGATARMLAAEYGAAVTAITISPAQFRYGESQAAPGVRMVLGDWLRNPLDTAAFDVAIAIESTEHMPDLPGFFRQAARILRPGGRLLISSWLAHPRATPTHRKLLLDPACRESRMAHISPISDYRRLFAENGFRLEQEEDLSQSVKRTWPSCAVRFATRLLHDPRYLRFLVNRHRRNRTFGLTMLRIWLAFQTGALRYGVLSGVKEA